MLSPLSTNLGQAIEYWQFGNGPIPVFMLGGVHGDEIEGIDVCEELIRRIIKNAFKVPNAISIVVVPRANPDGILLKQRSNANNVDLNRNLPTSNWRKVASNQRYRPGEAPGSEQETKALLSLVELHKPKLIISMHSFTESLLLFPTNEFNAAFRPNVEAIATALGLPIVDKMNYEVFGSLSRWGSENQIATLTMEMPKLGNFENTLVWADEMEAFLSSLGS